MLVLLSFGKVKMFEMKIQIQNKGQHLLSKPCTKLTFLMTLKKSLYIDIKKI